MAGLTRYGTLWGQVPPTTGQVFWVAPQGTVRYYVGGVNYQASDGNDGRDPRRAMQTIDAAHNVCTANSGDIIMCLPGDHALTASIAMDTAGVTLMGLPGGAGNFVRQKTKIDCSGITSNQGINITAENVEIAYLDFEPLSGDSAVDFSAAANNLHIHDCSFDMHTPSAVTGTFGIDGLGGAGNVLIDHCYFECDGDQGPGVNTGNSIEVIVQNCTFVVKAGTWVTAVRQTANSRQFDMRFNTFQAGNAAITNGLLGSGSGAALQAFIHHNHFPDSIVKGVDGYDAGDAELIENYEAGLGATDGGVIVTATT